MQIEYQGKIIITKMILKFRNIKKGIKKSWGKWKWKLGGSKKKNRNMKIKRTRVVIKERLRKLKEENKRGWEMRNKKKRE